MRTTRIMRTATALAMTIIAAGACGSSSTKSASPTTGSGTTGGGLTIPTSGGGTTVDVVLNDMMGTKGMMSLKATPLTVKAGAITFSAKNTGTIKHEMIVLSTTTSGADLVPGADGKVSEATNVGEVGDVEVGKTETKTITLKAGKYILACNIKDHYKLKMWVDLTVTS